MVCIAHLPRSWLCKPPGSPVTFGSALSSSDLSISLPFLMLEVGCTSVLDGLVCGLVAVPANLALFGASFDSAMVTGGRW